MAFPINRRLISGFSCFIPRFPFFLLIALLGPLASQVLADGTETLGPPSIAISPGTGVVANGAGLESGLAQDVVLNVPEGATVNQVLFYWADRFLATTTPDDVAAINDIEVPGMIIGGPTPPALSGFSSIAYRADITALGLIGPGMNTVSLGGLFTRDGAGIVVIYSDGGPESEIIFRDGADYANAGLQPNDPILGRYVPQTYNFPASGVDRMATLTFFAADAQAGRSDRYEIYVDNVLVMQVDDEFVGNTGPQWDVVDASFVIPAGATSVRVEMFSGPYFDRGRPDSFVWVGGFLDIMAPGTPRIDIEKLTNGVNADKPGAGDAPVIATGGLVTWSYIVTNTGDLPLVNVTVVDDQGVPVACPQNALAPMESMICTASGLAEDLNNTGFTTVPGLCGGFPNIPLYENMGTATGETLTGAFVQDMDPSHYCNPQEPDIDIEKSTNGVDADDPGAGDAPQIAIGELVTWTYLVTNTGTVPLTNVVVADDQGVPVACPQNTLAVGESMLCTASGLAVNLRKTGFTTVPGLCGSFPNTPLYENMGQATGQSANGDFVQDVDPSHYCNPQMPNIDIEKATNGVDADNALSGDAPQVAQGGLVNWTYVVTNTGNTVLTNVTVTDDQGVVVSCPQVTLTPGQSMICTASGLADDLNSTGFTTVPGLCGSFPNTPLYENKGEATGESADGAFVQDVDPSHYCNPQSSSIDIEKATNTVDADDPNAGDAPQISAGGLVTWTYVVTNTGNTPLTNVIVTDDQGVAVTCPQDALDPGESMICSASGIAEDLLATTFTTVPGLCGAFPQTPLYENMGQVTGQNATGDFVQDVDPSHYCNPQTPSIDIEKATNGVDADDPNAGDAPAIAAGNVVSWTYVVTNTGSVTLFNVTVTDDQGVAVSCPQNTLIPMQSMICTASGIADDLLNTGHTTVPGLCAGFPQTPLYENFGKATGETIIGALVQDDDPSHYCNPPAPDISVEKATNGVDADDPNAGDAPQIAPGDVVNWTYVVTNTGNTALTGVGVVDDQGVVVICPQDTLDPGESMICTASGVAEDTGSTGFTTVPGVCEMTPNTPLYRNMGVATGITVTGATVQADDPSHYCNPPACTLEVDKTCLVVASPSADFACEAKIAATRLLYTGPTRTNVTVVMTGKDDGNATYSNVDLISGQTILVGATGFTIDARPDDLGSKMTIKIDGAEEVHHTSCSTPYIAGLPAPLDNPKGAPSPNWRVEGFVDKNGNIVEVPMPGDPSDLCEVSLGQPVSCDTIAGDKPDTLTFVFSGGGCSASTNPQGGKHECTGMINSALPVTVTLDSGNPFTVMLGETFTIPRDGSDTEIWLANAGGTEYNKIHTSCSKTLRAGDVFGSLSLTGLDGQSNGVEIIYMYEVTNTGSVNVTNISVVDDLLGIVPGSPLASLAPGASATLDISALITETTVNTATVTGNAGATQCVAQDVVTVAILPPPPDITCSKPIDSLTMIWDGTQPVRVVAHKGSTSATVLADVASVAPGTELSVSGFAGSPNDVIWEIFNAGTSTKIGESKFHLSCSDSEMNGEEDCGKRQGDGKGNDSGLINDWILEGMIDSDETLDCTP